MESWMTPLELDSIFLWYNLSKHSLSSVHELTFVLIKNFLFLSWSTCHKNYFFPVIFFFFYIFICIHLWGCSILRGLNLLPWELSSINIYLWSFLSSITHLRWWLISSANKCWTTTFISVSWELLTIIIFSSYLNARFLHNFFTYEIAFYSWEISRIRGQFASTYVYMIPWQVKLLRIIIGQIFTFKRRLIYLLINFF